MAGLIVHASRSRFEAFMKCSRYGYLQFHWGGRGIVKVGKNIYLTTGIWLHKGLEEIGRWILEQQKKKLVIEEIPEHVLDRILDIVRTGMFKELFPENWREINGGYDLSSETLDEEGNKRELSEYEWEQRQQYTFDEQSALIEGLLRVFCLRVVPNWLTRFRIVAIELDMAFPLVKNEDWEVIQSARIDWVLQEIESKDLFLVSFKGYRQFGEHEAKEASHDTQGLSESWAFDEYLKNKNISKRIMGVQMLYLIKGARKETKRGNRNYEQQSPLIRGFRRLNEDGIEYAHSWFYPDTRDEDQRNESGVRALGKSWEKFDVFKGQALEELGGVKGWISRLNREVIGHGEGDWEIQPECGDILAEQVKQPEVYLRHDRDIESWLRQTKGREQEIAFKLLLEDTYDGAWKAGNYPENLKYNFEAYMDDCFPMNRKACHYYPGEQNDCQYIPICFGTDEERNNPLENGYTERRPHHKAELVQIEGVK